MPRLSIEVDRDTLAQVTDGGVIEVPVTSLEIEDGLLVNRFRVRYVDALGHGAHCRKTTRGPLLRFYLQPVEEAP